MQKALQNLFIALGDCVSLSLTRKNGEADNKEDGNEYSDDDGDDRIALSIYQEFHCALPFCYKYSGFADLSK